MSRFRCMLLTGFVILIVTGLGCRGKNTFQARRIDASQNCIQGIPTQVPMLHRVTVQWRHGSGVQGTITEGMIGRAKQASEVQSVAYEASDGAVAGAQGIQVTTHLCRLPILYGIDAIGTPIGTDDAKLEFFENGQIKKAEEKRDHQIDELISSVAEGAEDVVPLLESGRGGSNPYEFFPPLPADAQIMEILEISPLQ